jgi:hypothetical protein
MEDPTLLRETFEKIYQQESSPNKHNN